MKKDLLKILLIGTLSSSLYSQEFISTSFNQDIELNKFILHYKNKNYKSSFIGFSEYLEKYGLNKSVAFMLGRSAFELGKYDEALIAYEKVLYLDPNNPRVKLEMAQTYFKMSSYDKAEALFEEVLKYDSIPEVVKKNIKLSLASLKTKNKKSFLTATLIFGVGFDSNINNEPSVDSITYGNFIKDVSKESDELINSALSLSHIYRLSNSWNIKNQFMAYTQKYMTYKEKDFDIIAFDTKFINYSKNHKVSFGVGINHIWLNNKDYSTNFTVDSSFLYKLNEKVDLDIQAKTIRKNYADSNLQDKESNVYELKKGVILSSPSYGINSLYLTTGIEKKIRGNRTDIDQDYISLSYNNKYPLSKTLMLINNLDYSSTNYKKVNLIYSSKREDKKTSLTTTLVKSINKNLAISAVTNFTDVDSNQLDYEYNKYSIKTNVYYSF